MANVLNTSRSGCNPRSSSDSTIWAATKERGNRVFEHFIEVYKAKSPKAVECLVKDRGALLCLYDFPAEQRQHLRNTNPIESTFATAPTKGCGSDVATRPSSSSLFHHRIGPLGVVVFGAFFAFGCIASPGHSANPEAIIPQEQKILLGTTPEAISKQLGAPVVTSTCAFSVTSGFSQISGYAPAKQSVDEYVPILATELELFPTSLFERIGIVRIELCAGLKLCNRSRLAVPDIHNKTLYLDVGATGYFARRVIHHELFHLIDWSDDGNIYYDRWWAALNPPGFSYGGQYVQDDPTMSVLTEEFVGFLNKYCMTGIEEDKAEVFSCLVVDNEYVMRRASGDEVIRDKVEEMKALLYDFCEDIDEEFWTLVSQNNDLPVRPDLITM